MIETIEDPGPYPERTRRIGIDVPSSLREELSTWIFPGMLSQTIRALLLALIETKDREGIQVVLSAILNKKLIVSISKHEDKDED